MSQWIKCSERLPECKHEFTSDDTMVSDSLLVTDESDPQCLGMAHFVAGGTWTLYGGEHDFMYPENITHWMPFPERPGRSHK